MEFQNPYFLLFGIPALAAVLIGLHKRSRGRLRFSSLRHLRRVLPPPGMKRAMLARLMRITALVFIVIALARPRHGVTDTEIFQYGADIMFLADISPSMLVEDFRDGTELTSRLEGVKKTMLRFLDNRKNNRVGIIAFARDSRTLCPLTLDYEMLKQIAGDIGPAESYAEILRSYSLAVAGHDIAGTLDQALLLAEHAKKRNTAIGIGIANAVNRLRKSSARSRVIILLTDGRNNAGWISPQNAAALARAEDITLFAVGTVSFLEIFAPSIDEQLLRDISARTGGGYFRAQDVEALTAIYERIAGMKETRMPGAEYVKYINLAPMFILSALGLCFIELVFKNTMFLTVP